MGNQLEKSDNSQQQILIDAYLYTEGILKAFSVDGIVCFMDSQWRINNELYETVFCRGGNRFTSSHNQLKHAHKSPRTGDVFDGDGGLLPCKSVLYTVSYDSLSTSGDKDGPTFAWTLENISTIVENQLQKASDLKLETIAVPYHEAHPNPPLDQLLPALYCKLMTNRSTIKELHLITMDADIHQKVKDILTDMNQTLWKQVMPQAQSMPLEQDNTNRKGSDIGEGTKGTLDSTGLQTTDSMKQQNNSTDRQWQGTTHDMEQETSDSKEQGTSERREQGTSDGRQQEALNSQLGADSGEHLDLYGEESVKGACKLDDISNNVKHTSDAFTQNPLKYEKMKDENIDPAVLQTFPDIKNVPFCDGDQEQEEVLDFENDFESFNGSHGDDDAIAPENKQIDDDVDICPVCLNEIQEEDSETLSKCQHKFCKQCLEEHFEKSLMKTCPVCRLPYRTLEGNQPEGGIMYFDVVRGQSLPGYEGYDVIVINYEIPDGVQGPSHPNPGVEYRGARRTAFLPDTPKGNMVLRMLQTAFDRKLIFTVGTSVTTGKENVVTWNDIHHKTRSQGGPERFGYPDAGYLDRVIGELKAKGITEL